MVAGKVFHATDEANVNSIINGGVIVPNSDLSKTSIFGKSVKGISEQGVACHSSIIAVMGQLNGKSMHINVFQFLRTVHLIQQPSYFCKIKSIQHYYLGQV